MINSSEDLAKFKEFFSAGGLVEVQNLTKGKALLALCGDLDAALSGCVNEEITDYQEAGVLVETMQQFSAVFTVATGALGEWVDHLTVISEPSDLEQVSIGVSVMCKLNDTEDNAQSPSIKPIVSKTELNALEAAINGAAADINAAVALMAKVNEQLMPALNALNAGGSNLVIVPPPATPELDEETKQEIELINDRLMPQIEPITGALAVVSELLNNAKEERELALDVFKCAVAFTLTSNQVNKPSISDATQEMLPK